MNISYRWEIDQLEMIDISRQLESCQGVLDTITSQLDPQRNSETLNVKLTIYSINFSYAFLFVTLCTSETWSRCIFFFTFTWSLDFENYCHYLVFGSLNINWVISQIMKGMSNYQDAVQIKCNRCAFSCYRKNYTDNFTYVKYVWEHPFHGSFTSVHP